MIYIGDYFAISLVIILCMFFFDSKTGLRRMSAASKLFVCCLVSTAITAATDIITVHMLQLENVPLWQNMLVNTLYFVFNIISTSSIALYLFTKILEHTHDRHCMKKACIGLTVLFVIYLAVVAANLKTGWLFSFEDGEYCRGPLNALGYYITVAQMGLVVICYTRNRKNASRPMRRALLQTFPVIPMFIIVQRIVPDIMLNTFVMAEVETVLFMTFMGQRQGVHSLTELNDRHRFIAEVDHRIASDEPFQIFLINIKDFSSINQKYGHLFGDEFLYSFAFELDKLFRNGLAFHMNGTVFAVMLRYTYQQTAEEQSGILLDFLEKGVNCAGIQVNSNYVLVHYVSDGTEKSASEIYEIMENAANKAYSLKHHYIRCTGENAQEVARRRYLLERLQKVDRVHGFEVWFQPIKCMKTGKFSSAEALVRLHEADGSTISPAEFIPLAEQTGYISSITWFVLEEVCRMLKYSSELEGVSVSINLPMSQLLEKGFLPRFNSIVNQAGISHNRICIEFTERAILDNFEQVKHVMEEMAACGYRFYLDDFGTGYSNFSCSMKLPLHTIKLDRCLVRCGQNGSPDYAMVHALVKVLHDMGMVVVAEGAESEEEVRELAEQGVDAIQGFALARPMPFEKLTDFYSQLAK